MRMRPFRFGASVSTAGSRTHWIAKARRVEDLGFDTLLVADHLAELLPPFAPLVTAAEATIRLRVGTLVLNNDFRHSILVAREAAAIDLLTDGRFELGIGAGHSRAEYDEAGIPFGYGPTRVDRLEEAVAVITALFAGGPVSVTGRHYHGSAHTLYPRSVQRPRPPLLVGGNHPRVLALAARAADIVGLTGFGERADGRKVLDGFSGAGAARRIGWVRQAAGDRFDHLELQALVQAVVLTPTPPDAAVSMAHRLPGLTAEEILSSPFLLIGTADEMAETLRTRRAELGISYYAVFEKDVDTLAPVIARLRGT